MSSQTAAPALALPMEAAFEIKEVKNKNKGVVAVCSIPRGTLLHAESPIFKFPHIKDHNCRALFAAELSKHDKETQRRFFELYNSNRYPNPLEGIVLTNGIPVGGTNEGEGGIFLIASRFNHSCLSNAVYTWQAETDRLLIYALEDIKAGDEICVNYLTPELWLLPTAQRIQYMRGRFEFDCACKACGISSLEVLKSDNRRIKVGVLRSAIGSPQLRSTNPGKLMTYCKQGLELLRAEGGYPPTMQEFYNAALEASVVYGDFARARCFTTLVIEYSTIWQGPECDNVKHCNGFLEILKDLKPTKKDRAKPWSTLPKDARDPQSEGFEVWLWKRAE